MAANDVYRAAINTIVNGINCLNVFHFIQIDNDGVEVPPDSLKAALETILLPAWVPFLSPQAIITSVVIRRILPTGSQPSTYNFVAGDGTNAGTEAMPPNVAVVASHYSNTLTKRGRGRVYYAGIPQTEIENSVPKATFVALFATFKSVLIAQMMDAGSAIHWQWVHYSPTDVAVRVIVHVEQRMQLRLLRERIKN